MSVSGSGNDRRMDDVVEEEEEEEEEKEEEEEERGMGGLEEVFENLTPI